MDQLGSLNWKYAEKIMPERKSSCRALDSARLLTLKAEKLGKRRDELKSNLNKLISENQNDEIVFLISNLRHIQEECAQNEKDLHLFFQPVQEKITPSLKPKRPMTAPIDFDDFSQNNYTNHFSSSLLQQYNDVLQNEIREMLKRRAVVNAQIKIFEEVQNNGFKETAKTISRGKVPRRLSADYPPRSKQSETTLANLETKLERLRKRYTILMRQIQHEQNKFKRAQEIKLSQFSSQRLTRWGLSENRIHKLNTAALVIQKWWRAKLDKMGLSLRFRLE